MSELLLAAEENVKGSLAETRDDAVKAEAAVDSYEGTERSLAQILATGDLSQRLLWQSQGTVMGWCNWDGRCWKAIPDKVPLALQLAIRSVITEGIKKETISIRAIPRLESARGMQGIATCLVAYPQMKMQTDVDPTGILAVPSGCLDLLTGEQTEHQSSRRITRCCPVDPGKASTYWSTIDEHLKSCLVEAYDPVRRYLGSSLLGRGADRKVLWLCGPGGDGKSTLVKILKLALGDYMTTVAAEVFSRGSRGAHGHELSSGLAMARLAVALEVEGALDWSRIKGISGGDEQVSKRLHGKTYTYNRPPCLVLVSNQLPQPPDQASAERLIVAKMVPPVDPDERFIAMVNQPGPDRDALASACLSWMISGCNDFLEGGIGPVPVFGRCHNFFDEWFDGAVTSRHLIVGGDHWTPLSQLSKSLEVFLCHNALPMPPDREISQYLQGKVKYKRFNDGRRYNCLIRDA